MTTTRLVNDELRKRAYEAARPYVIMVNKYSHESGAEREATRCAELSDAIALAERYVTYRRWARVVHEPTMTERYYARGDK